MSRNISSLQSFFLCHRLPWTSICIITDRYSVASYDLDNRMAHNAGTSGIPIEFHMFSMYIRVCATSSPVVCVRPVWASISKIMWLRLVKFRGELADCHCPSLIPALPSWMGRAGSLIHIFVWGQGTVGAFSSLSPPCPWLCSELALPSTSSPHHCVPRHRDDTQHVPWI